MIRQEAFNDIVDTVCDAIKRYVDERVEEAQQPLRDELADVKNTVAAMLEAFESSKSK